MNFFIFLFSIYIFSATQSWAAQQVELKEFKPDCAHVADIDAVEKSDQEYAKFKTALDSYRQAAKNFESACSQYANDVMQSGVGRNNFDQQKNNFESELNNTKRAQSVFESQANLADERLKNYGEKNCRKRINSAMVEGKSTMNSISAPIANCAQKNSAGIARKNETEPLSCDRSLSLGGSSHSNKCTCPDGMAYSELTGKCSYGR